MHLRSPSGQTLQEIRDELHVEEATWEGSAAQISVHVDDQEPTVRFGSNEVPFNTEGQLSLAKFANIPTKFYERVDPDERQFILSNRLDRSFEEEKDVIIRYNQNTGFLGINPVTQTYISPFRVVDTLLEVFPAGSEVIEWRNDSDLLHVDVVHDIDSPHTGGDPQVNDLTRGGVRVIHDRGKGVAPEVHPYLYRLICTNGMETPEASLRIEGRGRNANEILANLELNTQAAVDRISSRIEQFYALRQERIEGDATQAMLRLAQERGLSPLVGNRLASGLPADEEHTMFSLINRITNYANHPDLENRPAQRRNLEAAGGTLVAHHGDRCAHCSQTL